MKVNISCRTNGNGYWSVFKRETKIYKLELNLWDEEFNYAELRAFFTKKTWDPNKHGLIYTDNQWMREFRQALLNIGFSEKAIRELDYSEQGMQGDNYVSMDCGIGLIREWAKHERNKTS